MSSTRINIKSGILPWTQSCFVCGEDNPHGLHLKSKLEDGRVILNYTTRESDLGWRHIVHGGIVMTLLDEVMTWSAILAARRPCVAAELTVRLKTPIEAGTVIRVESRIPESNPKLLLTNGLVLNEQEEVLASASGKYVPMNREDIPLFSDDFVADPDAIDPSQIMEQI